jgi:hypothetical protein
MWPQNVTEIVTCFKKFIIECISILAFKKIINFIVCRKFEIILNKSSSGKFDGETMTLFIFISKKAKSPNAYIILTQNNC